MSEMQEVNERETSVQIEAEYVEKMCYEFSKLLYDVSEEHKHDCKQLEERCALLEAKCREYEEQILKSDSVDAATKARVIIRGKKNLLSKKVKSLAVLLAKKVFFVGRTLATSLGIKDKLKQSALFRKLYLRGTIDKLRE